MPNIKIYSLSVYGKSDPFDSFVIYEGSCENVTINIVVPDNEKSSTAMHQVGTDVLRCSVGFCLFVYIPTKFVLVYTER